MKIFKLFVLTSALLFVSCKLYKTQANYQQRFISKNDLKEFLLQSIDAHTSDLLALIKRKELTVYKDTALSAKYDAMDTSFLTDSFNSWVDGVENVDDKFVLNLFGFDWKTYKDYTNAANKRVIELNIGKRHLYFDANELNKKWNTGYNFIDFFLFNNLINKEDLENHAVVQFKKWKHNLWELGSNNAEIDIYMNDGLKDKTDTAGVKNWRKYILENEKVYGKREAYLLLLEENKVGKNHKLKSKTLAIAPAHSMVISEQDLSAFPIFFVSINDWIETMGAQEKRIFNDLLVFNKTNLLRTGF